MQKRTLLVFDWCGEADLAFYLLEDPPDWLDRCSNHFLNSVSASEAGVDDLLLRVNDAIAEDSESLTNENDPLARAWTKHRIHDEIPAGCVTRVIVCGFLP